MTKMRTFFYDFKNNVDLELPSRKRLYKRLGEYDSLAEYTFVCVKEFESNISEGMTPEEYVTNKAKEHEILLNGTVSLPQYNQALLRSFLVYSHAMLEDFVEHYKKDIRNLIDKSFILVGDMELSKTEKLLKALQSKGIIIDFPVWLLPTLKYYRLVRNCVAHSAKDTATCKEAYANIDIKQKDVDYDIFKEKAPNSYDQLTLCDLYFYSACIKHFANYLTMALKGKVNWENLCKTHEDLDIDKIGIGVNPISIINKTFNMYNHRGTDKELEANKNYIKEQKENKKSK